MERGLAADDKQMQPNPVYDIHSIMDEECTAIWDCMSSNPMHVLRYPTLLLYTYYLECPVYFIFSHIQNIVWTLATQPMQ